MPVAETWNARIVRPIKFGASYAQPCLAEPCPNTLCIDDLREGDIWACAKCGAKHEFYTAVQGGPGGFVKFGMVRLLLGEHVRASGEPKIMEFME